MEQRLKLEITTITIVHIIAIIIAIIFLMILFLKVKPNTAFKAFFVMQISMIGWMVFKIFKTVAPSENIRWSFIVAYYACICMLEVSFFEFGYAYYKDQRIGKKMKVFIYGLALIQFLIILTNPRHYLFYQTYDFYGDTFGPLFYVHMVIEYGFILVGSFFCILKFKAQLDEKGKVYQYLAATGIIFPIVLNLLYVSKILQGFLFSFSFSIVFDVTPIVFTWSSILFVYVTLKYEFFHISPIMRHEIVEKLDTPIGILDSGFDVIYVNEKLNYLFNEKALERMKEALEENQITSIGNKIGREKNIRYKDQYFLVYLKPVLTFKETQYLVTFRDVTDYKIIEDELVLKKRILDEKNKQLEKKIELLKETSRIGARTYVARELHDIIGHALVVTIKLLEVSQLYKIKNKKISKKALEDAIYSTDMGISQMKSINSKGNKESYYTGKQLQKELSCMLEPLEQAGIAINFYYKGICYQLNEKMFDVIKKICTELVTNCIKHSKATELLLSIQDNNFRIEILMMDNGCGSTLLKKGNGLNGIDQRLKMINGNIHYHTDEDEGFAAKIDIPKIL
jgi:signal transduction histidine kinase